MNDTPEEQFTFEFEKPQFQVSQASTFNENLLFFFQIHLDLSRDLILETNTFLSRPVFYK